MGRSGRNLDDARVDVVLRFKICAGGIFSSFAFVPEIPSKEFPLFVSHDVLLNRRKAISQVFSSWCRPFFSASSPNKKLIFSFLRFFHWIVGAKSHGVEIPTDTEVSCNSLLLHFSFNPTADCENKIIECFMPELRLLYFTAPVAQRDVKLPRQLFALVLDLRVKSPDSYVALMLSASKIFNKNA